MWLIKSLFTLQGEVLRNKFIDTNRELQRKFDVTVETALMGTVQLLIFVPAI